MQRTHASGRPIRWTEEARTRTPAVRRGGQRVAWDHSVLDDPQANIQWNARTPKENRGPGTAPTLGALAACWALLIWAGLGLVGVWTRTDVDAHVSMRLLSLGNFEEILGVVMGLIWFMTPAAAAFWVARHARLVSADTSGTRSYSIALSVAVIAGLGVLRPVWDRTAGTRFGARSVTTAPATPTESGSAGVDRAASIDPPADAPATAADSGISGWFQDEQTPFFGPPAQPATASADPG